MEEVEIKEWGNSMGIILPRKKLRKLGLGRGDKIIIDIIFKKRIDGFGICKGAERLKEEEKEEHEEFW